MKKRYQNKYHAWLHTIRVCLVYNSQYTYVHKNVYVKNHNYKLCEIVVGFQVNIRGLWTTVDEYETA